MKPKIYCVTRASDYVIFHRHLLDPHVIYSPTRSSCSRLEKLVPFYEITVWFFQKDTTVFIHTDTPVVRAAIGQSQFYPTLSGSPEDDEYISDQQEDFDSDH